MLTIAMLSGLGALMKLGSVQAVGFAGAALGVYWAGVTAWEKWEVFHTRSWPVTEGTIGEITSKLVDGGPNGVDYWKVTFAFTYKVTTEHTASYSMNVITEKLRDRAVAGLEGQTVRVHYNPRNEVKHRLWEDEVWAIW